MVAASYIPRIQRDDAWETALSTYTQPTRTLARARSRMAPSVPELPGAADHPQFSTAAPRNHLEQRSQSRNLQLRLQLAPLRNLTTWVGREGVIGASSSILSSQIGIAPHIWLDNMGFPTNTVCCTFRVRTRLSSNCFQQALIAFNLLQFLIRTLDSSSSIRTS